MFNMTHIPHDLRYPINVQYTFNYYYQNMPNVTNIPVDLKITTVSNYMFGQGHIFLHLIDKAFFLSERLIVLRHILH